VFLRTEDGANSTAHVQASLPRSRDLISRSPTIVLSELLLERRVRKEVSHEDRVVSIEMGKSVSIDMLHVLLGHWGGEDIFCLRTLP
jgi:hypothetical protein